MLEGNLAALFHGADIRPVTQSNPAQREEALVLFAAGLPPSGGLQLQPGAPAPADPLITTVRPRVFIGNPDRPDTETVVECGAASLRASSG